ncbi:MAG TPA: lactate racemase domain-containing protein [Ignavibacteriaceae bacterium]|nr:lactate racemase domain-containing protein [Ignavibacteriaceae bacterium]
MLFFGKGDEKFIFNKEELKNSLYSALDKIGPRKKVLAIPPDFTRFHSQAGIITEMVWEYYRDKLKDILPALGTHKPMSGYEIEKMYGCTPEHLFRVHDWRHGLATLGEVPSEFVKVVSEGKVNYPWIAQVNKILVEGNYDLILSIGQVVPHEVIGMANYNKNIFMGTGGKDAINRSHFLGAAYGMERIMGRADTPVRKVLNYASDHFAKDLPIVYIHTVVDKDIRGNLQIRGLYIGDDIECFNLGAALSLKVNFQMLDKPLQKVVVYLDPEEFKTTWLGNKSIYRTRMAIADEGELIVLAPGVKSFGEDKGIDKLIRKYGYVTTPEVLDFVKNDDELKNNLSAAAHLIHGSSEKRFRIIYCPGFLSREEIESVNYKYADLIDMNEKYSPKKMIDGFNIMPDGEEVFYISNPALGLWAYEGRFSRKAG